MSLVKNVRGGSSATPRRFSGFAMRKVANSYGLNKTQSKLLENVFRSDGVTDPQAVIESPPLLDKHFRRAYKRSISPPCRRTD
jgi:hypothetical protein